MKLEVFYQSNDYAGDLLLEKAFHRGAYHRKCGGQMFSR
jgi:hypothetical protein